MYHALDNNQTRARIVSTISVVQLCWQNDTYTAQAVCFELNILFFDSFLVPLRFICAFSISKTKNNKKNSNYIISIVKFISIELLYILPRFSFILVELSDNFTQPKRFYAFNLCLYKRLHPYI